MKIKLKKFKDLISKEGVFSDGNWIESKDQNPDGSVRLIQLADIGVGKFIDKSNRFMTEDRANDLNCTYLVEGDILVARMPDPIGRACIFPQLEQKCVTVVDICIVRPASDEIDSRWLMHLINSKHFNNQVLQYVTGTTRQRISRGNLAKLDVEVPPLDEQKRIAAILDKADAIRRKRQQAINLADDFLRSVFLDMFGDPVTNPKGYEKVCLGHVCKIKGGKRIPKGEKLVKENTGYPYIKAGNIKNGKVNTNKLEYVPHHVREKIARYTVKAGDVCLTVVGANIGDVGVVPNELNNASLTENANKLLIQNKKIITNFYLASALQMDFIQNQIKSKTMAVGVPKLALFRIEQLEILIPPMELQKRFESIVNKVDGYLDSLATSRSFSDTQFCALSQKAFAGEL